MSELVRRTEGSSGLLFFINIMKRTENFTEKQKKILAAVSVILFLIFTLLIGYYAGRPAVRFVSEPELFREWVDQHGIWGRIVYMGMTALQVFVAVVPGEPFEIVGGYAFGAVEGTLLCLGGAFAGSMAVFGLVRRFGVRLVETFFSREKIEALRSMKLVKSSEKRDALFWLLFVLPGTPKDLLCYFAGLTDMKTGQWIMICTLGRLPSIVTSTVGGNALGTQNYLRAAIVFAVTLVISLCGMLLYRNISKKRAEKKADRGNSKEKERTGGVSEDPS